MKNKILIGLLSITTSLFIGCGSSDSNKNSDSEDQNNTSKNIILEKGESIHCKDSSKFSVVPTEKPIVNFTKDITSGDITVTVTKESNGFVTVINCTEN